MNTGDVCYFIGKPDVDLLTNSLINEGRVLEKTIDDNIYVIYSRSSKL